MKTLLIIPAYNEALNIEAAVREIQSHAAKPDYVVINDCSTDGTADICLRNGYNAVNLPVNMGIGTG